jgi:very-short-patch-repair endonuclease
MTLAADDEWGEKSAWPDRAISGLAARQRTIITHEQLLALGVRPRTIQAAVGRGRLHRVHRGVYSLVMQAARPALAAEQAALAACGPSAVLSHHSAAKLHGLRVRVPSLVSVTVAGGDRGRSRARLTVHRSALLHPQERVRVSRLAVTSIARTIVDISPQLSDRAVEHLIDEALKRTSATKLRETIERHPTRAGAARVRRFLDPDRPTSDTWSAAEERLLALIRRAGLPAPEVNVPVGGYVADFLWRRQRVVVEFDSWEHHSGPAAFHDDRERHNALVAQGYQPLHITWRELTTRPERVLVEIAAALARAGGW